MAAEGLGVEGLQADGEPVLADDAHDFPNGLLEARRVGAPRGDVRQGNGGARTQGGNRLQFQPDVGSLFLDDDVGGDAGLVEAQHERTGCRIPRGLVWGVEDVADAKLEDGRGIVGGEELAIGFQRAIEITLLGAGGGFIDHG
jgi:hypothetical protein